MAKKKSRKKKQVVEQQEEVEAEVVDEPAVPDGEASAVAQTVAEDPLFVFLQKWWLEITIVVVAVLAIFWARDVFHKTYVSSMREAADVYVNLRQEYVNYLSIEERLKDSLVANIEIKDDKDAEEKKDKVNPEDIKKEKEESLSKLGDYIKALNEEKEPYTSIAKIYDGLLAAAQDDQEALRSKLEVFGNWKQIEDPSQRFFAELGTITLARSLLDNEKTEKEGRALLKTLSKEAQHVGISAVLTLARITDDVEEQKEVVQMMEQLSSANPEQSDLLSAELKRLNS